MRKIMLGMALFVLVAGVAAWAASNHDPIPQGEFAARLAEHLNSVAKPASGWTPDLAIKFLADNKITPISGTWEPASQILKEKDMAHILRVMGLSIYSPNPELDVTYAKAEGVFFRYDDFFKSWNLKTRTVQGETTTHIDTAIGGDAGAPVASPSTPD